LSSEPKKTVPSSATAGEELTGPPVLKVHFSWPPESTAWRARSNAPK
jgi:hypothetical protein